MGNKISDRMSGMIDHGFYATIRAVASHLGVSYHTAQRALRREFLAGDLKREWVGRQLAYTAKQLSMFGAVANRPKRSKQAGTGRRATREAREENQGSLF